MAYSGATVAFERRSEETELAHLGQDFAIEAFMAVGLDHAGQELVLGVGTRRVANHAFLAAKLLVEE